MPNSTSNVGLEFFKNFLQRVLITSLYLGETQGILEVDVAVLFNPEWIMVRFRTTYFLQNSKGTS